MGHSEQIYNTPLEGYCLHRRTRLYWTAVVINRDQFRGNAYTLGSLATAASRSRYLKTALLTRPALSVLWKEGHVLDAW
jgi:hypothetical protein